MRSISALRVVALVSLLCLLVPALAAAQSLKVRKYQAQQEERLKAEYEYTREQCSVPELEVTFDWSGFPESAADGYAAYGYCDNGALNAMESLCTSDALSKEAVQTQIQKVVCTFGTQGWTLQDGVLTFTIDFDDVDDFARGKEFLLNNL
ncbi:MAG: hypothetical protein AAGN46_04125 [Acidobacteriota bacterium]